MRHLSLECRFEAWFVDFRRQMQRQNANAKAKMQFISWMQAWRFQKANGKMQMQRQMHKENGFYALNVAFISWMPLWSVIFRFQNANTKAKCKCKGKCIRKWFLCPKCGIYLLNAALKRDFSISECKYKGKMQRQRQMHKKMVFMP